MSKKFDYHKLVDYDVADPAKVLAQKLGQTTSKNMPSGFSEVKGTRGESAYVFSMGQMYGAFVQEGLGTKSLVAQDVYKKTGKSYFANIAQDTVATVINDLISVGATPVVLNAYWSSSSYKWLSDKKLANDFINGWKIACDEANVVWGGGETQALSGVVSQGALEFAGSAFGVIRDKKHLISDKNLEHGDSIVFIESSGLHANGVSLAREIASNLPDGYQTKISSSQTFGDALLQPTILYAELVKQSQKAGLDIHYLSNITGHGWRKIMRANRQLTFEIERAPAISPLFKFIQEQSGNSVEDMYSNYNMGAGYAVYVPNEQAIDLQAIATKLRLRSLVAGKVVSGEKQVVIKPKNIIFDSDSLGVR